MKTRIIQTRFWDDDIVQGVSRNALLLWIFLLTNKELGMTNYFRIPDALICDYLKMNLEELESAKKELEETKRIIFYQKWICIPKLEVENKYKNSPKNLPSYKEELKHVPQQIKEYFSSMLTNTDMDDNIGIDSSINSTIDTNHKSKIKNQNPKISVPKFVSEINEKYKVKEKVVASHVKEFWEHVEKGKMKKKSVQVNAEELLEVE